MDRKTEEGSPGFGLDSKLFRVLSGGFKGKVSVL